MGVATAEPRPASEAVAEEPPAERVRAGARLGIPYAIAGFLLAISFGIVAEPVIGGVAAIVMSAVLFAGSAQFAAVAVLSAGGGAPAAIVAGILLNLRYGPMGVALAPSLRGGWRRRAAVSQAMIDYSWAAANRGSGGFDPPYMIGTTLPSYPAWVGGTVAGVLAGDLIGNPEDLGLDAIFPAFFLALLVEGELKPGRPMAVAALGAALALALVPFTPPGVPIIGAFAAALLGLLDGRRS